MISAAPACRMSPVNGRGSPKDSITALGRYRSACSTVPALTAQLWKPTPQDWPVLSATIGSSRSSQSRSPPPPPSRPRPPPVYAAAVSAPPAVPPIGASAMGCRSENIVVNAVDIHDAIITRARADHDASAAPDEILGTLVGWSLTMILLRDRWIRLEAWDAFATIAGGAAAALTGLLFVAVSIRADYIARSQELRNRAAETLYLFGTVLVIAILMAIAGQGYRMLGAELLALGVITGAGLYVLDRRAKASRSDQAIAQGSKP